MAKTKETLVFCNDCKNCTPDVRPEKCSVDGKPIIGKCHYWTESKSCLLSWPHVCVHYEDKAVNIRL